MDNWARACFQLWLSGPLANPGRFKGAFPMTSTTTTLQADVDQALICVTADEEIVGTLKIGWNYLRDGCPQAGHRMWPTFLK